MADTDLTIKVATQPKDPFDSVNKQLDDTAKKITDVEYGFGKIAASIATVGALTGAFSFVIDATRKMEDLTTQFVAFTGSAQGAADQLQRLSDFASKTPFTLEQVAEADRTLLAFGSTTGKSLDQLRQLGEVASATGTDLRELSRIFGQIQQDGRLTGEKFQQLIEKGINIGPTLAASLHVAQASLRGLIQDGKISADQVAKSFEKLTGEGGQYFDSTTRQSKTLTGSISTLSDNISILAAELGKSLTPALTTSSDALSGLLDAATKYIQGEKQIAASPTLTRISALNDQIEFTKKQLQGLQDIKGLPDSFSLGIEGDYNIVKRFASLFYGGDIAKDIDNYIKKLHELTVERNNLANAQAGKDQLKFEAESYKESAAEAQKAAEKKQAKQDEINRKLAEAEKQAVEERANKILEAERTITVSEEQLIAARTEKRVLLNKQANDIQAEQDEVAAKNRLETQGDIQSTAEAAELQRRLDFNDTLRKAEVDALNAREAEITSAKLQAEATRAELLLEFDQAEEIRQQDKNQKLADDQAKADKKRLDSVRKAQDDEFNIEKQTALARQKFDEQTYEERLSTANAGFTALASLMRSKNKEAFEIGKAAAIAQALFTIPLTAIKAYDALAGIPIVGPALGAAAATAAVVAGGEQIALIENTKFTAFADGGKVPGVGNKDTVPAMLTPGETVVPAENFNDLKDSFVRGAVNDDQVALLQAGNAITGKILDTLTVGTINEKLTTMISLLDSIKDNSFNSGHGDTAATVQDVLKENSQNLPASTPQADRAPLNNRQKTNNNANR